MYMVYFKLFFLKLEGLYPLYFLKNLLNVDSNRKVYHDNN